MSDDELHEPARPRRRWFVAGAVLVAAAVAVLAYALVSSGDDDKGVVASGARASSTERSGSLEVTARLEPGRPRAGQRVVLTGVARDGQSANEFVWGVGFGDGPFGVPAGCPVGAEGADPSTPRSSPPPQGETFTADHTFAAPGRYNITVVVSSCPSGRSLTLERTIVVTG